MIQVCCNCLATEENLELISPLQQSSFPFPVLWFGFLWSPIKGVGNLGTFFPFQFCP